MKPSIYILRLYCELIEDIQMEEQRVFVKWEERKATKEVKVARGGVRMAWWRREESGSFIWENTRAKQKRGHWIWELKKIIRFDKEGIIVDLKAI